MERLKKMQNKLLGKLNDKGSALLTVLLFVAFLTILATTLLYVTGMNFLIKQADYQNKKNFYINETALEEIKARLMSDVVAYAGKEAVAKSSTTFASAGNTSDAGEIRALEYNGYFTEEVCKRLYADMTAGGYTGWTAYLSSKKEDAKATVTMQKDTFTLVNTADGKPKLGDESTVTDGVVIVDEVKGIVTIKGITVSYINTKNGVAGVISTDLEIHAPEIDWKNVTKSETAFLTEDTADGKDPKDKKTVDISKCVRYTNWEKK